MKQYKHKQTGRIAKQFQDTGWYNIILDDGSTHPLMGYFIENTNDWEEITEAEPKNAKEEVIEGDIGTIDKYINSLLDNNTYESIKLISARLTVYPKPKKEYVRWVMKEFTENLKNDDCPIYRVIATKSDNEKYCHKIKITVEEE